MALEEFQVNYMYMSIYQTESHHVKSKRVLSIKAWINQPYIGNQLNKKCIVTRYENITIWQCILIISLFGVTFCVYIFVSEIKQTFFLWIHYWLLWITKALSYLPSTICSKSCSSQDLTTIKVTIELLHCNYTV